MPTPSRKLFFLIFIGIVIALGYFALRQTFVNPGTLGHNWDWSFPALASQLATAMPKMFSSWSYTSLGSPAILSIPVNLLLAVFFSFGTIGISGELVSKAVVFSTLIIGSIGMYLYLGLFFLRSAKPTWLGVLPVFLGAVFFGFSPFIFSEFIGGAVSQFISYAVIPFALFFFALSQNSAKFRWFLIFATALVLSILTISTHNLIIAVVLTVLLIVVSENRRRYFWSLIGLAAFYILMNLYWMIPFVSELFFAQTFFESESFLSLINVIKAAPNIARAWFQIGYARLFFENIMSVAWLPWWILGVGGFCAVLIGSVLKSKNKYANFWLLLFLGALVFVTAGVAPLGEQVVWLFQNVSVIRGFRSIQHFIPVSVFTFSVVLAFGVNFILIRLKPANKFIGQAVIAVLVLGTAVWIAPFIISGDIGSAKLAEREMSYIDSFQLSPGYIKAHQLINEEKETVRFLPLPAAFSPVYLPTEYQAYAQGGDPTLSTFAIPAVVADFAPQGHPKKMMQVFEKNICEENLSPSENNQLLSLLNIKYIMQRQDLEPNPGSLCSKRWFPDLIDDYLRSDPGLKSVFSEDYIKLYQLSDYFPRIYAANRNLMIDGPVDTLNDVIKHDDLQLSTNIFFTDLKPSPRPDQISTNYLRQSFEVEDTQFLEASGIWSSDKGSTTRDIIYPASGSEFNELVYKIPIKESGQYELYVKIRHDTDEGLLQATIDGEKIGQPLDVYYKSPYSAEGKSSYYYQSVKVGDVDLAAGDHQFSFASLPALDKRLEKYKQSLDMFYLVKIENSFIESEQGALPAVQFSQTSPTTYRVSVSGANAPYYLNFLETYNSNWKLRINGQEISADKHFVVNGYANSWRIDNQQDWQGEIVYRTQELFYLGLWLSGLGALALLMLTLSLPYFAKKPKQIDYAK